MDFKPSGKAGHRTTLKVAEPGVYLVRVETRTPRATTNISPPSTCVVTARRPDTGGP